MFYLVFITLYIYIYIYIFLISYITGDDHLIWSTGYKNYILITLNFNALISSNIHPNNYIGNRILKKLFLNEKYFFITNSLFIKSSLVSKCPLFHLLGEQVSGEQLSVLRLDHWPLCNE